MYFTITTTKEIADDIKSQCEFEAKFSSNRSYELGDIIHNETYSVVQIKAIKGRKIEAEDVFWLGHHSANNKIKIPNGSTHQTT